MIAQSFCSESGSVSLRDASHIHFHPGRGELNGLVRRIELHLPPADVLANLRERPRLFSFAREKAVTAHQGADGRVEPTVGHFGHMQSCLQPSEERVSDVNL